MPASPSLVILSAWSGAGGARPLVDFPGVVGIGETAGTGDFWACDCGWVASRA